MEKIEKKYEYTFTKGLEKTKKISIAKWMIQGMSVGSEPSD
jgi:hypothetical protein